MNNTFLTIGVALFLVGGLWLLLSGDETPVSAPRVVSEGAVEGRPIKIIAFGDSLTAGYGIPQADSYPDQLEAALRSRGYNARVINAGVSGETTRGNVERANFIRSQDPDMVILGIGGNDSLRALPVEETEKNIRATIEILQGGNPSPSILLLHMRAALNAGFEYKRKFDGLYETIAEEKNVILVPFITGDIFLSPENKLDDGIHFNRMGYQKIIDQYLLPRVTEVLDEMR